MHDDDGDGGRLARDREALRALAAAEDKLRRIEARARLTIERWGGDRAHAMARLARTFPSLHGARGTDPWDAAVLIAWARGTGVELARVTRHAIAFLLQVWHREPDWRAYGVAPFNVAAALAEWDEEHADAFRAWCEAPFVGQGADGDGGDGAS